MKFPARFWTRAFLGFMATIATPTAILAGVPRIPFAEGIYLFGQSPLPEQIGQEYLIFRVRQGKAIGAIYAPQSEYSCFSGTITPGEMNLSIRDPYENQVYRHSIALKPLEPLAAGQPVAQRMSLEGYHAIETIQDSDRSLLKTCLEKLAN